MTSRVACLFPAFAMRQRDFRRDRLDGYREVLDPLVERAARLVVLHPQKFAAPADVVLPDELEDDLQAQYACYIDNCAAADLWRRRFPRCDFVSGYSMGVFAALYRCGALTFEDGLQLMHAVCTFAHEAVGDAHYGMGAVMGLTVDEVRRELAAHCPRVEISDICGLRVVICSGERADVEAALEVCERAGALNVRLIPVKLPFHASWLTGVESRTAELIGRLPVRPPQCGLVSSITQEVLTTAEDVRREVARNVAHPMNWYATMRKLLDLGVETFLECGLSDSLTNLAQRNVKGKYKIYNVGQIARLLASVA